VKGDGGEGLPEKLSEVEGHHITSYSCKGLRSGIEGGVEFGMKRERKTLREVVMTRLKLYLPEADLGSAISHHGLIGCSGAME